MTVAVLPPDERAGGAGYVLQVGLKLETGPGGRLLPDT